MTRTGTVSPFPTLLQKVKPQEIACKSYSVQRLITVERWLAVE
jgi:hypothetical protein